MEVGAGCRGRKTSGLVSRAQISFPLFDTHLRATSLSGLSPSSSNLSHCSIKFTVRPPPPPPPLQSAPTDRASQVATARPAHRKSPPHGQRIASRRRPASASQVAAARPAHRKSPPHGPRIASRRRTARASQVATARRPTRCCMTAEQRPRLSGSLRHPGPLPYTAAHRPGASPAPWLCEQRNPVDPC